MGRFGSNVHTLLPFERLVQGLKPKKGNLLGHVNEALRASFVALLD